MNRGLLSRLLRCVLVALLCIVAGGANAAYVNRFNVTTNGGVTFTGNTLGLNKAAGANNPGTSGSIGAFIAASTSAQVGTFPAGGTTLAWAQNGSTAQLVIPLGSTVLYAELIWSGSYSYGTQNVSASLGNSVTFTTPAGATSIAPAAATSQTVGTAGGSGTCTTAPCFYVRSQNVTAQVVAGGSGTYSIGGVPATVGASEDNSNTAGWTLAVVYGNSGLPARNMTVFVGAEIAGNAAATVTGFCTAPAGPRSGRLMVSALEGDSNVTGDQMKFGPTTASLVALSGTNNLVGNFFASQINKDNGTLDTSGTFGAYNVPNTGAGAGRQGYDISNVDISATLLNSQTAAAAQGTTTGDQFMINALGLQINVGAPAFPVTTKTVDKASTFVGDVLTYTISLDNTTGSADATSVVFTDTPPPGTSLVANSVTLNGVVQVGANPQAGVAVGTIAAGTSKTVTFKVLVNTIPASPAVAQYPNSATWTYQYVPCTGQPTINATLTTNPAVTTIARLEPTKTYAPAGTVVPGQTLTYTIAVPNTGTANTAAATLADAIPAGTTYVAGSTTLNGGAVADVAGAMPYATAKTIASPTRAAGQINAGETATVVFKVVVNAATTGPITNVATVDVDGIGIAPAVTAQVVANVARLVPIKSVAPSGAVAPGQQLTYTIAVPNSGNGNSAATTLADPIPAGTTYVAGSTTMNGVTVADVSGAMPFASAATIASPSRPAGQINAGETATIVFKVVVGNSPGAGPLVNTASIDPDGAGPGAVLTAQASSPVLLPDLVLGKSHSGNFVAGGSGSYTVQVSNAAGAGQVSAGPITVTDTLPAGLTLAALPSGSNWNCAASVVGSANASCTYSGAYPVVAGTALAPIALPVNVAVGTAASITNTASVTAAPGETATANNSASDPTTVLAKPTIGKAFAPATVAVNASATLTLTLTNPNASALSGVAFADAFPSGLVVAATPALANSCGGSVAGATAGSGSLSLSGASLASGASCTVAVAVTSAAPGGYANTAGGVASAETGAAGASSNTAVLTVQGAPQVAKSFAPATIATDGRATLTLTFTNPGSSAIAGLALTDTYPSGLVNASPSNVVNTCGGAVSGGTFGGASIGIAGASLAGNASCTLSVDVTSAAAGSYVNTTGNVTSSNAGTGSAASATLTVLAKPTVAKSFTPAVIAGGQTSTLMLTIANPNGVALTGVALTDAFPSGLVVAATPALTNDCGGSVSGASAGATSLALSGGAVSASGSCSIGVAVTATAPGGYTNTAGGASSTQTGTAGAPSNSALLTVLQPPAITKAFAPNPIAGGGVSTLTLTLTNSNAVPLIGVAFNDAYPFGLVNASVAGASNSCGGVLSGGLPGGNSIGLSGATLLAGASCSVSVKVTAGANGSYANTTGAISATNAGTGNTASATLIVAANPTVAKAFAPTTIATGATSTLTLTLVNSFPTPLTGLAVADNFPAGLVVAAAPALANGCGGSVSGATPGSNSIALSGGALAANTSCTVTLAVTAAAAGSYPNTTGPIASAESGTAGASNTAVLNVLTPPTIAKAFNPTSIPVNSNATLTLTIANPNANALTGVAFSDVFPAGLKVSAIPTASNSCGGSFTGATAGSSAIGLAGANLAAGASCTVALQVTSSSAGSLTNTAGGVASNEAPTGTGSSATILVVVAPDLRLTKTHAGSFTVGSPGVYVLTVDNTFGSGATSGTISVTDTLPTGLAFVAAGSGGAGWSCASVGQVVTCTSSDAIAAGASGAPITLNVSVAATAVPAVTNQASVAGGAEPAANAGNNSAADFTVVDAAATNAFAPDGRQTGAPGTVVAYPHTFNAGSAGTLGFAASNLATPAVGGWSNTVYRDDDCNGVLDGAEAAAPFTGTVAVAAGAQVCIVVREFIPASAPLNAQDQISIRALFTPAGGGALQTLTRTDLTTVGSAGSVGLSLAKTVRNLSTGGAAGTSNNAVSGQVLEYSIAYVNNGSGALSGIVINDATPAWTRFVAAACTLPLPAGLSACSVTTEPAPGGVGAIVWTLGGGLAPGAGGSVTFRVTLQ